MNKEDPGTICYPAHGNLYLNITNRCTCNCIFCIKNYADGVYGYNLILSREPEVAEVIEELGRHDLSGYDEVVFTGLGEPLSRLDDVLEITRWLKARDVSVRIDTIGHAKLQYPNRDVARELKKAGVDEVSVSLNTDDKATYDQLVRPRRYRDAYESMKDFSRDLVKEGINLRFTVLDLPSVDIEKCRRIAEEIGASFKVRGYGGPVIGQ
ncbi:MAG: TatD family nuclease-associated radical SAM protein [Methanosarcinales archaeon]|jgi:TatD family-associated radical SAM protein|nr:TatD family nuclease-associated radical SAM protein [Methanosarcinales archaeon]MRG76992.1 radical SAM protein [ANME-2 cluster archaeon]